MKRIISLKKISLLAISSITLMACIKPADVLPGGSSDGEDLFSGTLQAAMARGVPMKCSYEVEGNQYEGLVKGNKYAGKMKQQGNIQNVIMTEDMMYTWEEGKTQGLKVAFNQAEMMEEAENLEDLETSDEISPASLPDVNYRCLPTLVTDAAFTPPQSVTFLDLDSMMNGGLTPDQLKQLEEMSQ